MALCREDCFGMTACQIRLLYYQYKRMYTPIVPRHDNTSQCNKPDTDSGQPRADVDMIIRSTLNTVRV